MATNKKQIPAIKKELALASVENSRTQWRGKTTNNALGEQLQNINNGISPYKQESGCFSVKEAILLCQKAYFNVAIFRNTIDIQSEFANSKLHFKKGSKKSIAFFSAWYDKIGGPKLADQFFREWYRSSNFFAYKTFYTISPQDLTNLKNQYGGQVPSGLLGKEIPLRYIVLNPADIMADNSINYTDNTFSKLLSESELKRLKNPSTDQEREFLASLPPDTIKQIKSGGQALIKLKPENLVSIFAKKQDYEPLSVPMYFPVLFDIDLKLEFKKIEHAIARTVDYVVLMVTTGDKDNGVDKRVVDGLQAMFQKESVGRVIVADYSTEAEFVIPDLSKVLGPEKYEVVNRDIANGLMNIFFEDQKFSNSYVKAKIFLERLQEARRAYLNEFLIPEMKMVAETIGIRDVPQPFFEDIDLSEQSQAQKVYTRLAELGMLTPDELFEINTTGIFPDKEVSIENQREHKKLRDAGLYEPLIGGSSAQEQAAGRPSGTKAPQTTKKVSPQKSVGSFSLTKIKETSLELSRLIDSVEEAYKLKYNHKRLSKANKSVAFEIVKQLISNEPIENWNSKVNNYINGEFSLNNEVFDKINTVSAEHDVDIVAATILLNSKINE
jgi:hypothetical protein